MYHFTDVPSFVSGDYLVAFDPHAAFLGGEKKGMKIAFEKMRLADKFPDTTAPFLHFGCTMRERYPGTLFRFPLRSALYVSCQLKCFTSPIDTELCICSGNFDKF